MRIRNPKGPGTYVTLTDRQDREKRICFTIEDAKPEQVRDRLAETTAVVPRPRRSREAATAKA